MPFTELWLMFALGLVSSLHCVQMCGPIVVSYSLPRQGRPRMWLSHVGYNTGRVLTYTVLGAIAGAAGQVADVAGHLTGHANGARILAGVSMLIAGAVMLWRPSSGALVRLESPSVTQKFLRAIGQRLMRANTFQLGLLMGLLPCGLIYGALLKSVDAGAILPGALSMLAFGLGTAQALLGIGFASNFLGRFLGSWSNRLAAVSLFLVGVFLLWRGLTPAAGPHCHVHS